MPDSRLPAATGLLAGLYFAVAGVISVGLLVHRVYWAGLEASTSAIWRVLALGIGTAWLPIAAALVAWVLLDAGDTHTRR